MADEKPKLDQSVTVTPDNMLDHPHTPSDMLHQHLRTVIAKPEKSGEDDESIKTAVTHPNIEGQALSDAYDYLSQEGVKDYSDALPEVLKNPKLPADRAEAYLKQTHKDHEYDVKDRHSAASQHPGVSRDLLEQLATEQIEDPDLKDTHDYKNLSPEFYHKLLENRPIPEPEEGQMTDRQKATNRKAKKIDELVAYGLGKTPHHTPESLDQTISAFAGNLPHEFKTDKASDVLSDLVHNQKNLTPEQVDKIASAKFGEGHYSDNSHRSAALTHPNADPKLLARYANSTADDDSDMREVALQNPNLPEETKKAVIDSDTTSDFGKSRVSHLLQNPSLTPDDVKAIYAKDPDAIAHPNAPQDVLEDFAAKNKTADGARKLLKRKELPPSVLKSIVSGNKNESVVEEALKHGSTDMSVIEAALKRKAPWAQQAAMRHPLVAKQYLNEGLKSGKVSPHDYLFDKKNQDALDNKVPPESVQHIDKQYEGNLLDENHSEEDRPQALDIKNWLATNTQVPRDVRDRNAKELVQHFTGTNSDHDSKLGKRILNLAQEQGNPDAQAAVLDNTGMIDKADLENKNYSSSFLDEAYKMTAPFEDSGSKMAEIANNPNVSLDLFRKITHDPKFLAKSDNVSSRYKWKRGGENSIFDRKFADLAPEEREVEFNKLLALGTPEAKAAFLNSSSAPKKEWNQQLASADPTTLYNWFDHNNELKDFADEDTLRNVLNYHIRAENPRYPGTMTQEPIEQALSALNPESISHRHIAQDYVNKLGSLDEIRKVNRNTIAKQIDSGMFSGQLGDALIESAFRSDPTLGAAMIGKKHEHISSSDSEQQDAALRDIDGAIKRSSDNNSGNYRAMWESMLSAPMGNSEEKYAKRTMSKIGKDSYGKPNGKLDFLADLPGDNENGYEVRQLALNNNLISHDRASAIANDDPEAFTQSMGQLGPTSKNTRLTSFVDSQLTKPEVSAEVMKAILESTSATALTGWGGKTPSSKAAVSEEQMAGAHDLMGKISSLVLKQPDPSIGISHLASVVTNGTLTKANSKKMLASLADHVNGSPLSIGAKSAALLAMYDQVSENGDSDLLPSKMRTNLVKQIMASGELEPLVHILNSGDATPGAWQAVAKALKTPENLSNDSLFDLAKVATKGEASPALVSNLANVLADRASIPSDGGPDIANSLMSLVNKYSSEKEGGVAQSVFLAGFKMAMARPDEAPSMVSAMLDGFSNPSIGTEHKIAAFRNLPGSDFANPYVNMESMGSELANTPAMIEAAQGGWKLAAMAASAPHLSPDTAKVVANRLVNDQTGEMDSAKADFVKQILISDASPDDMADSADVVKVLRSMGTSNRLGGVLQSLKVVTAAPKHYMIIPTILDSIQSTLSNPEATVDDLENNLGHLADIAEGLTTAMNVDTSPQAIKIKHDYMIRQSIDAFTEHSDAIMARPVDANVKVSAIQSSLTNIFNSASDYSKDKDLSAATSQKYLDLLSKAKEYQAKVQEAGSGLNMNRVDLGRWAKVADLNSEGWQAALQNHPEIAFSLDSRNSLSNDILQHIDYSQMLTDRFSSATRVFDRMLGKIGSPDRPVHVRKILEAFSDAINDESVSNDLENDNLDSTPTKALKYGVYKSTLQTSIHKNPSAFDLNYLKKMESVLNKEDASEALWYPALKSGAGGTVAADHFYDQVKFRLENDEHANQFASSPSITDRIADGLVGYVQTTGPRRASDVLEGLVNNTSISKEAFRQVIPEVLSRIKGNELYHRQAITSGLMHNQHTDKDLYIKLYNETKDQYSNSFDRGKPFHPAFTNAKFGGDLFRSLPVTVPDQFHDKVNPKSLVLKAEHSVAKDRLNQALATIPPQGITWADFKKTQPKMQNWPEVKQMFLSKNNKPVMPEDVASAMSQHEGYDFHVTYTDWTGAQRHTKAPNMVMQMNTSEAMQKKLASDPKRWAFFQFVQKSANHVTNDQIGGHPVTPHCASWVRVDVTGGKKGWIIEEFQSDFGARMHGEIDALIRQAQQDTFKIDEYTFSADEMHQYTNDIEEVLSGWHMASLKAVEELAKKNGAENLYLHGSGIRATLSGMSKTKTLPVWLQNMYDRVPKAEKWESVDYSDYPNKGSTGSEAKKEGYSSQCWKKPLK